MEVSIAEAVSKAKTVWLQKLLKERLPYLPTDIDDCYIWYDSWLEAFVDRGLIKPSQQKNFLTQVRNAIKVLNPEHPALNVVKFDTETWVDINNTAVDRIANRTTKLLDNPDFIVETGVKLLKGSDWSEIAAGLAVLTGRRVTEVIKTAQFEYKSVYSVMFTGSLKRRGEPVECIFEIPTLCEAELIIEAITDMRRFIGEDIINELSKEQIAGKYSRKVAKVCDAYFHQLVPKREDKDNLYTHLFRSVYSCIATHWYCPITIPEIEYRSAIQGHYQILDEKNPELRRSIAADRHYFDYKIADGRGNIDGSLGIKLGQPGVEIIEQFLHASPAPQLPHKEINRKDKTYAYQRPKMDETVTIPRYQMSRFHDLAGRLGLSDKDTLKALFDWAEVSLSLADLFDIDEDELKPSVLFDKVEQLAQSTTVKPEKQHLATETGRRKATLSEESINELSSAVNLLASIVANQHVPEKSLTSQRKIKRNLTRNDLPQQNLNSASEARKPAKFEAEALARINHAIDKIIEHNNQEGVDHKDKFRIGIGTIKKLTGLGDRAMNYVLDIRKDEISDHNQLHRLGERHNSKGYSAPAIKEVIVLE